MDESLTEQRRVSDEGFRSGKALLFMTNVQCVEQCIAMTVVNEEATANYVPAAAVIRRWRALSGIIGRKEHVGGLISRA